HLRHVHFFQHGNHTTDCSSSTLLDARSFHAKYAIRYVKIETLSDQLCDKRILVGLFQLPLHPSYFLFTESAWISEMNCLP
ncbi:hypothetical protein PMAYCL1PPCAC_25175, partial [Pristionchus mayeri]